MKTFFTAHPSSDREKKNLLFLNLIKKHKSTSRTEISKLTNINIVTVSNYINGYLKNGLVVERGYEISSGGRRPELVELNQKWGYTIGIDIGVGYIKGILVDLELEVLASAFVESYDIKNLKVSIKELLKKLFDSSPDIEKTQVKKIGISVISKGVMDNTVKIKNSIEEETDIPMLVGNSALCAAFGEKSLNLDAAEVARVLYTHTDLGQGIFIKDEELCDTSNGESRYAYLRPWGRNSSIVNEAKRTVSSGIGTKIIDIAGGNIENITMETVIKAAVEQDELAVDLIRIAGMNLGVRIAYLINLLEPEAVIIGGGIEKAGSIFLEPLISNINRFILQMMTNKTTIKPAALGEEAAVKGGASLARREVFIEA